MTVDEGAGREGAWSSDVNEGKAKDQQKVISRKRDPDKDSAYDFCVPTTRHGLA